MSFEDLINSRRLAIPHHFIPEILKAAKSEKEYAEQIAYRQGVEDAIYMVSRRHEVSEDTKQFIRAAIAKTQQLAQLRQGNGNANG